MTLTPNGQTLCWLGAAVLAVVAVWVLADGPSLADDTGIPQETGSPTVQCVSVLGGVESEPESGQLTSLDGEDVAAAEASDVVHESATLGEELSLEGTDEDTDTDQIIEANASLDSVRERIATCGRARDVRIGVAGGLLVPTTLLAAVALCATRVPGPPRQRDASDDVKRAGA